MQTSQAYALRSTATVLLGLLLSYCSAAEEKDVATVLGVYVDKVVSSGGISYDFVHHGEGTLAAKFPHTTGRVKIIPGPADRIGQFDKLRVVGEMKSGEKVTRLDAAFSDGVVYALDEDQRVLLRTPAYRTGVALLNYQYIAPFGLLSEIQSAADHGARIVAKQEIGGIPCLVVEYESETVHYRYFVGEKDAWIYRMEGRKDVWGDGALVLDMTNPTIGERFSAEEFEIALPAGYTAKEYSGDFPSIGEPAPEWTLTTFSGKEISLKELRGKVVVMDFWATWCGPCVASMPQLQKLHDKYADRSVRVFGINVQETGDAVTFAKERDVTYPLMNGDAIAKQYNALLPMAVVIDQEGAIVDLFSGYFGKETDELLESMIVATLERTTPSAR
jgi:thiol-disulfide isomerase/thioredoxin